MKPPKEPLPRLRPFKFSAHLPDAEGSVTVGGKRATRQVLKLRNEHRGKCTWSCGLVSQNDIDRDRYVIVDHFEGTDIIDYMVETQEGLRELKRFFVRPGIKVVIELTLDGKESDISTVVDSVLDAGVLQDAINDYDPAEYPVRVLSATLTTVKATMVQRTP